MAIAYKSEPVLFAANPKFHRFSGVVPGSKATFIATITPQQDDPSTRHYTETFYRYADANGVIEFDEQPMRQRGAAAMYQSPSAATNAATWSRNLETYFESAIQCWIAAAEGEDYNGGEITEMFIWGGTDVMSMLIDVNRYVVDPYAVGSKALSRATTIEVNKHLPSFLLFHASQSWDFKITITAAKGAITNALTPSNLDGQLNTQYLATTYAEGEWELKRTDVPIYWDIYYAQEYKMLVKNDACELQRIQDDEIVYLRWLNSLGGYSFGLFEIRSRAVAVQPSVRYRDYAPWFTDPAPVIAQSDVETLSKLASVSLSIGRGVVGWDQFEDLEDLSTSIEVLRFFPKRRAGKPSIINSGTTANDRWLPVQISGGSNGDRSKQYNDFSCVLTMPQSFTQTR